MLILYLKKLINGKNQKNTPIMVMNNNNDNEVNNNNNEDNNNNINNNNNCNYTRLLQKKKISFIN